MRVHNIYVIYSYIIELYSSVLTTVLESSKAFKMCKDYFHTMWVLTAIFLFLEFV
jgi:hypothetical protein